MRWTPFFSELLPNIWMKKYNKLSNKLFRYILNKSEEGHTLYSGVDSLRGR